MRERRGRVARVAGSRGAAGLARVVGGLGLCLALAVPAAAPAAPVPSAAPAAPSSVAPRAAGAAPAPSSSTAAPVRSAPSPGAAFDAGRQSLAAGELPAALEHMEAALAADPDNLRYASEYRHAVIRAGAYDRALDFFAKLVADHPGSAFAWLNYGYVYVDKMPSAGAITQVILANDALQQFTRSIELKASWIALYTRGNSYLYWPKIFGRGPLAVADLERAVAISKSEPKRAYQAHAYAALGEAYWRTDQPERARATWEEGARLFPQDAVLKELLSRQGDDLEAYVADQVDRTKRVNTDLRELWEDR
jgi:tetratricopeptide (TPR) repeat protein